MSCKSCKCRAWSGIYFKSVRGDVLSNKPCGWGSSLKCVYKVTAVKSKNWSQPLSVLKV